MLLSKHKSTNCGTNKERPPVEVETDTNARGALRSFLGENFGVASLINCGTNKERPPDRVVVLCWCR